MMPVAIRFEILSNPHPRVDMKSSGSLLHKQ
jgi:hypothetical protein